MKTKNYLLIAILFFVELLALNVNAQTTWGTPVRTESQLGTGGTAGFYPSLKIINGNPAVAYYGAHGYLLYVRAVDANASSWNNPVFLTAPGINIKYISLQVVNGNPAVAYYEGGTGALLYVRATDANGTSWGTPVVVDSVGNVGNYASLQVANGKPAIAYCDATNNNLKYIQATDATGASWGATRTLAPIATVGGQYCSMQIVGGNPAVAYRNNSATVGYIRASNADGTTWGTAISIPSSNFADYTSLQIVNGKPAVSYYKSFGSDLMYVCASDANGTTWNPPVTADATGSVGKYTSLQEVNGNPAISYYDAVNYQMKYVRATDAGGTTWGTSIALGYVSPSSSSFYSSIQVINSNPAIVYGTPELMCTKAADVNGASWNTPSKITEINGVSAAYASLQIINTKPAISYYDQSSQGLKYVNATNTTGTLWATPVQVGTAGSMNGQHTSLQVVNGNPAISYQYGSTSLLKYVRASDADGTAWGSEITVDNASGSGYSTSLKVVNGRPAIAYQYTFSGGVVKYVRAANAAGSGGWLSPITVDVIGSSFWYDQGEVVSLEVVNGNPAIAYYSITKKDLKYVRATNPDGTAWGTPVVVDSTGNVGLFASMQIVNGKPAIAYHDATNGDLKYIRATDADGTIWGSPISVDTTGDVGEYTSLQIIKDKPAIAYRNSTTGEIKYISSNDTNGFTWNTPETTGAAGLYTSMLPMNSGPGIAYCGNGYPYFVSGSIPCSNPSVPSASASVSTICSGAFTSLNIASGTLNDAANWQWYSASCGGTSAGTSASITVSPTITTTYYVRGEGGCVTPGTCGNVVITVNTIDATVTQNGNTLTASTSGASYQWINCNGNIVIAGATSQSFTATTTGTYAAIVTKNGCTDTSACFPVTVVGIKENTILNGVSIYPNPSETGLFNIILPKTLHDKQHIIVKDITGKRVYSKEVSGYTMELNLSSLDKGTYILVIEGETSTIKKIVIQ